MDDSEFRIIDPERIYGAGSHDRDLWPEAARELAHDAEGIVHGAVLFFVGSYPMESPFFPWGKSIDLPWLPDYLKTAERGKIDDDEVEVVTRWAIGDEVRQYARALRASAEADTHVPTYGMTYWSGLGPERKTTLQGLAVEAMLAADRALWHLLQSEYAQAARNLSSAYQNLIECVCQAQIILGIAGEKNRAGGIATNKENRALKRDVFAWLEVNGRDMKRAAAARAIDAAKLVPDITLRTIEDWFTEWERSKKRAQRLTAGD
ncbi:MAG: hypothetical protein ABIR54_07140 [Burkholderiaceae bacterium]